MHQHTLTQYAKEGAPRSDLKPKHKKEVDALLKEVSGAATRALNKQQVARARAKKGSKLTALSALQSGNWGAEAESFLQLGLQPVAAGAQPAAKFDIHGVDECPLDPKCGSPLRQLRRLALRQHHTFARHQEMVPAQ